jgi:hypothetical protein
LVFFLGFLTSSVSMKDKFSNNEIIDVESKVMESTKNSVLSTFFLLLGSFVLTSIFFVKFESFTGVNLPVFSARIASLFDPVQPVAHEATPQVVSKMSGSSSPSPLTTKPQARSDALPNADDVKLSPPTQAAKPPKLATSSKAQSEEGNEVTVDLSAQRVVAEFEIGSK